MLKWISIALLLVSSLPANGQIFQCQVNGQKVFSDQPCGDDATTVNVDPVTVGGRLDSGTNIDIGQTSSRRETSRSKKEDPCSYINSTDLRRYTIKNRVVKGMRPASVRRSWGSPDSISTGNLTQWAYHEDDGTDRYVYFRNGCVTSWNGYYPQD